MRRTLGFIFFVLLFSHFHLEGRQKNASKKKFQYEVAACMMFQNESFFLKEWIEYHKLIGIEHFYLFNNNSTDDYLEILHDYIVNGEVELFHITKVSTNQKEHAAIQYDTYNRAFKMASKKAKWLVMTDADEFLYPVNKNSLPEILKDYEAYGGLYVNYLAFGTASVDRIPHDRLIIETLNMCAPQPLKLGKSIVRPRRVSHCTDAHRMWYMPPYNHVNTSFQSFDWLPEQPSTDVLMVYHYSQGDINHSITVKYPRRNKWYDTSSSANDYVKSWEWLNAKTNNTMQRFIPKLRERMQLQQE